MHLHFEKSINAKCDCTILSMSWMGKVPEELPEEEGWKLNRTHYYQEGWLAAGNVRGILGVTFTTSHWKKNISEVPHRTNYNLRGHRAQITLVQWNEPYQKLASCDSSGIIFVWIKFEGRWSIELINDRNTPVTHFSWSHDGRMALICYQDGFVLVGSVAGQRYWSSMLNLDATITCGIWTPDDQHVYFGTSSAQIIVMDVHGMMISQVQLPVNSPIGIMTWSCEKFKMEENEEGDSGLSTKRPLALAVSFRNGLVYLMKNYDDISPIQIYTGMQGLLMEWSNSGEYLTVAGSRPVEVINESGIRVHEYFNSLHFYNHVGIRVLNIVIPATECPVTALTWGHNDKRLFVATGKLVHVGWVSKRIASLQLLCRLAIYKSLSTETCVSHLPLPLPVRALISSLHNQTIYSIMPNIQNLREFASHPPAGTLRLHCTIIRHDEDVNLSPGTAYTLYVEYLGGLLPILKGKRTSKFRPEFVIFDPQNMEGGTMGVFRVQFGPSNQNTLKGVKRYEDKSGVSDSSESEDVDLCSSPRLQRRRHRNRLREKERELEREREQEWERNRQGLTITTQMHDTVQSSLVYNDVLPENERLVEVTSNIWGTKFKINGLASSLPDNLGQVTYKTSLLHLQPRQMTLLMTELRDDIFISPDLYSHYDDDEEDFSVTIGAGIISQLHQQHQDADITYRGSSSPLAPVLNRSYLQSKLTSSTNCFSPTTQRRNPGESTSQDEFPYVDLTRNSDITRLRESLRNSLNREGSGRESLSSNFSSVQSSLATCYNSICQICENGVVPQSPKRSVVPTDCTVELHERQNSLHRVKASNLVTRAHIERIDENTSTASTSANSRAPPGGGPSRICWAETEHGARGIISGISANAMERLINAPIPVTAPIHVRRSMSASYLDNVVDRQLHAPLDIVANDLVQNSPPKRFVLVKKLDEISGDNSSNKLAAKPRMLKEYGKSKSLDSYDLSWWKQTSNLNSQQAYDACPNCRFPINESTSARKRKTFGVESSQLNIKITQTPIRRLSSRYRLPQPQRLSHPVPTPALEDRIERLEPEILPRPTPPPAPTHRRSMSLLTPLLKRRELASNSRNNSKRNGSRNPKSSCFIPPDSPQHQPKSSPNTPASQRKSNKPSYLSSVSSPFRQLFANSPLLTRRKCKNTTPQPQIIDSSDEEDLPRCQSPFGNTSMKYQLPRSSIPLSTSCCRDPDSYHKGQLSQKLRSKKIHDIENSPGIPRRREFLMHNKAPMWNENSQVYQLDFGGRVTQESAKNFQIEFRGKQVMQFGRIDGNAYTLDFQYPFSALQAFAVALANVTQRLK